ncbi:hypothetical protein AB6A40_005499 [Gnathostoma spinigerum]|uniref:Uncharacterized protein n=1 Tax=Gnathostoma spinigerum TaxID=75299 RepID=A0ABD6EGR4_9BILA
MSSGWILCHVLACILASSKVNSTVRSINYTCYGLMAKESKENCVFDCEPIRSTTTKYACITDKRDRRGICTMNSVRNELEDCKWCAKGFANGNTECYEPVVNFSLLFAVVAVLSICFIYIVVITAAYWQSSRKRTIEDWNHENLINDKNTSTTTAVTSEKTTSTIATSSASTTSTTKMKIEENATLSVEFSGSEHSKRMDHDGEYETNRFFSTQDKVIRDDVVMEPYPLSAEPHSIGKEDEEDADRETSHEALESQASSTTTSEGSKVFSSSRRSETPKLSKESSLTSALSKTTAASVTASNESSLNNSNISRTKMNQGDKNEITKANTKVSSSKTNYPVQTFDMKNVESRGTNASRRETEKNSKVAKPLNCSNQRTS